MFRRLLAEGDPGGGGTTPPEGDPQGDQAPPANDLATNPEVVKLLEAARREAAAEERKKLTANQKKDADKKKAEADQDYKKLYEDAEKDRLALRQRVIKAQAIAAAEKLNAVDPDVVVALIPADVEEDDVEKAVAAVRTKHPKLFVTGNVAGGSGTGGAGSPANGDDMNMRIRRAAGRVS